jgi:tripartite ATP-independent transporter DctM subunit
MTPVEVGLIGIAVMFALVFLGMHLGIAMGIVGVLGVAYLVNMKAALAMTAMSLYTISSMFTLSVVPLFIVMGQFAAISGVSRDVYTSCEKWLRRQPGGLALASIAGCAAFAAVCGSSLATAATMGTIALPEMRKHNYSDSLATGSVAAGGTLGFLIPPSIGFIIYAILTEQSVGKLLIAGLLPGILLAFLFMVTVVVWVKLRPDSAPASAEVVSWKEKILSLRKVWAILVIFVLIMGGIYAGFFTPSEGGAVGAMGTFLFALGRRQLTWPILSDSLKQTAQITCMLVIIFYGATLFSQFLALTQIPRMLATFIDSLAVSRYIVISLFLVLYLILGCIMDVASMLVITLPVVLPAVLAMGFDPVWFGVICVLMMEAGLITPPLGLNVFVINGVAKEAQLTQIFRGVLPFLIAMIAVSIILIAFPQVALFLPETMK